MHDDLEVEADEQRPIKQSFCASLRRDAHWKCLILTLLIAGCLATIAWCRLAVLRRTSSSSSASSLAPSAASQPYFPITGSGSYDTESIRESPCDDGYVYIPVAFVIMLYLVYLVECWHSHTRIELQYKVDINTVYDKIRDMREGVPIIWWKAICYHYVRRTRQVTRYRNGDAFTSTQVYYERVNTCTAGSAFNFTQCGVKDISRQLQGLEDYPATKIRFSKGFSFASVESECEFEDQRAQFFQEYEARDDYMEGREGMDILNVNFKEYMIAFADPDNLPWYVSHLIFWIASFLLLSWPLRVIIEYKTAHLHYHVHKLFGTNYVDAEALCGTLSRVSTMNSTEMEMNIRNNNFMVPSYSDALLMNAARRASVLSALTTSGGGPRCFFGSSTPRSLTNPALHNSRSGNFVPGSLPSIPMTNVRRFHSCTAINHGDKPPITQSRSSILANLLGLNFNNNNNNSSTANMVGEENAANQRMDRRRWRRKRPMSAITFSASMMMGSMLPTTPETPEGYLIALDASTGSAIVTHFHADGNTVTTTGNNNHIVPDGTAALASSCTRPSRVGGSRAGLTYVGSSQSMTLSETLSGNISSATPSEGEAPPAYNEALGMPKLYRSGSQGQRMVGGDSPQCQGTLTSSDQVARSRILLDATRPRLQHSESLRLLGRGECHMFRFYRSTSQGLENDQLHNFAALSRNDSAPRMSHHESTDRPMDAAETSLQTRSEVAEDVPIDSLYRYENIRVRGRWSRSCSTESWACQPIENSISSPRAGSPHRPLTQRGQLSDAPNHEQGQNNESCPPSQRRSDIRAGASAPYTRLDFDEQEVSRSGATTSRARLDLSRIPLRLPSVVAPCRTLSDDEDMTPLKETVSLASLIGSSSSLASSDRADIDRPQRSFRGTENPIASGSWSSPAQTSTTRGEGVEGSAATAIATAAASQSSSASASASLISPSTAQRCYRSIRCMETSL